MEFLRMCSGFSLPSLPRQELPFARQNLGVHTQQYRDRRSRSKLQILGHRIGADRLLVRAKRRVGEEEEAVAFGTQRSRFVYSNPEVSEVESRVRRPFWQRAWEFGGRGLGFGGTWEEDPRGQRELEEFDLFLEGRGVGFQWKDVLEPSVENVLALVLTGLLLYAVVLIGWQLLLVAAAITLSALKYAVIAAVLLGVLIFCI